MRKLFTPSIALGGALASLVCPVIAAAHGPPSAIVSIDNRFDGEAEVYIDGRYQGIVAGDTKASYSLKPGCVNVVVQRPGTGFRLAQAELHLAPGATTLMPVAAPQGQLQVRNNGEIALKLSSEGSPSVWVKPGTTVLLPVETGNVSFTGAILEPRGEWVTLTRNLWVEPGQLGTATVRPDPTVLIVTNYDRTPVHALIDGKDLGWIDPGATQRTWVKPGPANIVLLDTKGRVRTSTAVTVKRGQEASVVVGLVPVQPPPVVVVQPPKPVVVVQTPPVVVNASWSGGPVPVHAPGGPPPRRPEPPCHD